MHSRSWGLVMKQVRWLVSVLAVCLAGYSMQTLAQSASADQAFGGPGRQPHFTAEQAARGRRAFAASCAMCHGAQLTGTPAGPALNDSAFRSQFHDSTPTALYAYIVGAMPSNAPGSLASETYADLTAFLFQSNGFAPGDQAFVPPSDLSQTPLFGRIEHDAIFQSTQARHQAELTRLTPVDEQTLRAPPPGDWLIWRRTYDAHGYSPLTQINRGNVGSLQTAWSWSLPLSSNEITPLVHDGVLFIKAGNTVQALDAANGDLLWQYVRHYPAWLHDGRTEIVKAIAIYQNSLYVPFLDGHLLALDIHNGRVLWDHVLIGPSEAASRLPGSMDSTDPQHFLMVADGGPIVADGEVIVGLAGCSNNYKGGCFIVGLNARTGQEDWRFNTIARPGQPGGDSWNGAPVDQRFGASVWIPGSYSPQTDLVYFGIGQTYHLATLLTRGPSGPYGSSATDALYTDSTVALDPHKGRLVWFYQHFPGDVWDLDWAFEQTLLDAPAHGRSEPLVLTGGKIGIFDALDAASGHYRFSRDLGSQNIVTGIDPLTGVKHIDPALVPTLAGPRPHNCGFARDEPATAYDPQTHLLYVPFVQADCPDPRDTGPAAVAGTRLTGPGHPFDGLYGRLVAFDPNTGKLAWMHRQRASDISSVLATAGGIVFDGTLDRYFRAWDARTGRLLWQVRLSNAPKSSPITYTAHGRQYVAVVAGPFENAPMLGQTSPEIAVPTAAASVWVFALPAQPVGN